MAGLDHLRLLQFRAGYNLPVHAAVEHGIFAKHDLEVEVAYTPGSHRPNGPARRFVAFVGHHRLDR